MKIHLKKTLILFILLLINVYLFGHPHVFMDNTFTFVFKKAGLEGIRVKWIFDDMFSASIIMDYDTSRNGRFEKNEITRIENEAFANLKNFDYFLSISINNKRFKITSVTDFKAEIKDYRLIYDFFVPLEGMGSISKEQTVEAVSYDETFFCYISNAEVDPVKLEGSSFFEISWEIIEDKKFAYFGDTIIPKAVSLRFRKKDG